MASANWACAEFERDLERSFLDGEEKVALIHHLPIGEVDALQVPADARSQINRIDGLELPRILVPLDDPPMDWIGDGDRRPALGTATAVIGGCRGFSRRGCAIALSLPPDPTGDRNANNQRGNPNDRPTAVRRLRRKGRTRIRHVNLSQTRIS